MPAAFIVVTIGRNPPVASANPVTTPVPSATGRLLTVEATPEVPIETRTSPGRRSSPSAAAMLSPVPAAIGWPAVVWAATSPGGTTRGSRGSWPSAALARSGRQAPSWVAK